MVAAGLTQLEKIVCSVWSGMLMMERTHVFGVLGSKIDGSAEWVSSFERGAPDFMDSTIHTSLAALWVRSSPRCVVAPCHSVPRHTTAGTTYSLPRCTVEYAWKRTFIGVLWKVIGCPEEISPHNRGRIRHPCVWSGIESLGKRALRLMSCCHAPMHLRRNAN